MKKLLTGTLLAFGLACGPAASATYELSPGTYYINGSIVGVQTMFATPSPEAVDVSLYTWHFGDPSTELYEFVSGYAYSAFGRSGADFETTNVPLFHCPSCTHTEESATFTDANRSFSVTTSGSYSGLLSGSFTVLLDVSLPEGLSVAAIAVPGPIAGAGLVPLFGVAGAWFTRRRRQSKLAA